MEGDMIGVERTKAETVSVTLAIAGDPGEITAACQRYCEKGLCVSVTPMVFVYTYGREQGALVGFINYPRFPKAQMELEQEALTLGKYLLEVLSQRSCTIEGPETTVWLTRREP